MIFKRGIFKKTSVDETLDKMNQDLKSLTSSEEDELKKTVKIIHSGSRAEKLELSEKLKDCSQLSLFKFSNKSQAFKNFCTDAAFGHLAVWINELKDLGYPSYELFPLVGEQKSSILDQYLAAFFYIKYLDLQEIEPNGVSALFWLAKACEFNSFDALLRRCKNNCKKIQRADSHEMDETIAIGQILQDLKTLGNYYWSLGYFHASLIFLELGNYYGDLDEEGSGMKKVAFHMEAVKNFYYGSLLAEHHLLHDQELITTLSPEKGLGIFGFKNELDAENALLEKIDKDLVPYQNIRKAAKEKIDQWIKVSNKEPE